MKMSYEKMYLGDVRAGRSIFLNCWTENTLRENPKRRVALRSVWLILKMLGRRFVGLDIYLGGDGEFQLINIPLRGDPNFEPRYFVISNAIH